MEKAEQETHVNYDPAEGIVRIYTTVPKHIRKLRAHEAVTVVIDRGDELSVTVPMGKFDPLTGFKRKGRVFSEEEKAALRERFARAREKK